ncbi:MAG: BatD family protein [Methylacidiphilales bacterium]|nr:BatD family protein [Candidatus Methylacidiphilales bacterium]
MKPFFWAPMKAAALCLASLSAFVPTACFAAATLTQQIDPAQANVGDPVIVTLTFQGGSIGHIQLPHVDGLEVGDTRLQIKSNEEDDGTYSTSVTVNISLMPMRPGHFVIPAFDIQTQEGDVVHVKAMKLEVPDNGSSPSTNNAPLTASVHSNGPVIIPPPNAATAPATPAPGTAANTGETEVALPEDPDGAPAKVFIIITPQTTDAYVGQSIPMQIDFYIRMQVNADQNSLPTIKGTDFLMNSFTTRGRVRLGTLQGLQYECETWNTAISAPKSGDFPLSMERDTYWVKSITTNDLDPFGGYFTHHANLAHEMISSNQLSIHIHPLPDEGRPAHFSGAIGQFAVTGNSQPDSVAVGEPVMLRFSVNGEGNFDYVRCPVLADDPAWKAYVPGSKTDYLDESRTRAVKTFEQAVIPQKSGVLPLPQASFSYFDPTAKQYVTVPIALPEITVTGSAAPLASTSPDSATDAAAAISTPPAIGFLPNRPEAGSTQMNLTPVYRQPWFWAVQGGLISLPLLGVLLFFLRARSTPDPERTERARRQRSLQQEEEAMAEAVQRDDALAFFLAARHAIQLQLGDRWNLKPEALTLGEIRRRDPQLAETLGPLFAQADKVIYSGQASADIDLAQWEQRVRTELLQPQPA